MNTNPKVRVIKEHRNGGVYYPKGHVFTPWGTVRDVLLARGLVEIINEEAKEAIEPPVKLPRASKKRGALSH